MMRTKWTILIGGFVSLVSAQISPFIHVDQFGYLPNATKVAVLSDPQQGFNASLSYTPSSTLQVRDATTHAVVFSGSPTVWNFGNTHIDSGDKGWWFDFSSVTTPGIYYVYDPVNNQKSAEFLINSNVYSHILKAAGRMFYYNRCNIDKPVAYAGIKWSDGTNFLNPGQDTQCRYIYDQNNPSLEKDLSGGWFDAGDYNKYVTFTYSTLSDLLMAYLENPSVFTDNWNIPESGNGIPDILDEVKWELDWLLKMTNPDGSTHIKVGSRNHNENTLSPPSANTTYRRYYGPTCTSASATIAVVCSLASIVYGQFPVFASYSNTLLSKAEAAFNYVLPFYNTNTLQTNCDDLSIVAGDSDVSVDKQREMMVAASVYLFEKTGNSVYHNFLLSNYSQVAPMSPSNWWSPYSAEVQDALVRYTQLTNANTTLKTAIINSYNSAITNNWGGFFGFSPNCLYRSYVPNYTWHWGSNRIVAGYGNINIKATELGIGNYSSLMLKASELLHYFHGVNPLGMVMLTNMYGHGAERCANEMYHMWFADGTDYDNAQLSVKGPAPGYVVGGANKDFTIASISPPANQPAMKSYKDWNTGWPENSWEITEPAIYYQASYIRLLSKFSSSTLLEVENFSANNSISKIFPNPATDSFTITFSDGGAHKVSVFNLNGQIIFSCEAENNERIDLKGLHSGVYMIVIDEKETHKLLKK